MADYEIGIAIALGLVTFFIFQASFLLAEKHWQLKMGLFYGALALGWATVFYGLILAQQFVPGTNIETAVTNAYYAYTVVGVLCVIYIGIRMFAYALGLMLGLMKRKKSHEEMQLEQQAW